jgi:hypothetical protein
VPPHARDENRTGSRWYDIKATAETLRGTVIPSASSVRIAGVSGMFPPQRAPGFQLGTYDFKSLPSVAPLVHWAPALPQVAVTMICASWSCLFSKFWDYPFISRFLQARADGLRARSPGPIRQNVTRTRPGGRHTAHVSCSPVFSSTSPDAPSFSQSTATKSASGASSQVSLDRTSLALVPVAVTQLMFLALLCFHQHPRMHLHFRKAH